MAVDRLDARLRVDEAVRAHDDRYFVDDFVWLLHALGLVLLCATLWLLSLPGLSPVASVAPAIGWGLFALWWGGSTLLVLAAAAVRGRRPPGSDLLHLARAAVVAGALVIGLVTQAPLHARFELSRPALDRLAQRGLRHDGRVGLFHVRSIERLPGGVRFLVHDYDVGEAGFAYSPRGKPREVIADSLHEWYEHLEGPWYVWYRDAGSS